MATIHKKVWQEYFEKIISGKNIRRFGDATDLDTTLAITQISLTIKHLKMFEIIKFLQIKAKTISRKCTE